jgi:hypothetical protein
MIRVVEAEEARRWQRLSAQEMHQIWGSKPLPSIWARQRQSAST